MLVTLIEVVVYSVLQCHTHVSDCFDRWPQTVTSHCEEFSCEEAGDGQVSVWTLLYNPQEQGSDAGHPVQNGENIKYTIHIYSVYYVYYTV